MSEQNVEIVRRGYEAFARGEIDFETLDSEIEWRGPREFPDLAEAHHGHDGVRRYMAKLFEAFDDYYMAAEEFLDLDNDRVLVFAREGGRGKGSGAAVETNPTAHLYTLRNGKAIRMQSYWDRTE